MPYRVSGMFDGGRIEVQDVDSQEFQQVDVNDLIADKKALDEIVEIFNTSDTQNEAADAIWSVAQERRPDTLIEE